MTFGYHRVGVLITIVNALSIFAIAGIILHEAYSRFQHPLEVQSILMLSVAIVGLGANIFVAFWLRTEQRDNLNIRSAFWHALGDALASVGVIIGGLVILLTGWSSVDPIISALIGLIIIVAAWQIFKEGMRVLLEATPSGVDIMEMIKVLKRLPTVKDVHDIHVWSISPELRAISCHVLIDDISTSQAADIRKEIEEVVEQQFHIEHTTVQMECQQCNPNDLFCTITVPSEDKEGKNPSPHHH
jgi:cobalt-zinc-cadmium efflux system protein